MLTSCVLAAALCGAPQEVVFLAPLPPPPSVAYYYVPPVAPPVYYGPVPLRPVFRPWVRPLGPPVIVRPWVRRAYYWRF